MPSSKIVTPASPVALPSEYEDNHVHAVYDAIAPHFSSTRYKPWPVVASFVASLPAGSVGLDSGTGNGKYLPLPIERPAEVWTLGLDRSRNLLEIAQKAGGVTRECIQGDVLEECWREGVFDYAISIATIHHLSTPERRKQAIQNLLRSLSPSHGRALIYVWSTQQDSLSKRVLPRTETTALAPRSESLAEGQGQDVFVPWILSESSFPLETGSKRDGSQKAELPTKTEVNSTSNSLVFNRYYHMFDRGELRSLVSSAAEELGFILASQTPNSHRQPSSKGRFIEIVKDDWERSNYYVELRLWVE